MDDPELIRTARSFRAVISHCIVQNTIEVPPEITITLGASSGTRSGESVDRVPADASRDSGVTL
ncbi:hypothetical protein ABZV67_29775 [Streptomyces sp. NPDC005065]|uniref:hypothetical protein n=1 Tax=Streptomyces sp. NPDC005065 TaxID=3154461 RepID=UPI0033A457E7